MIRSDFSLKDDFYSEVERQYSELSTVLDGTVTNQEIEARAYQLTTDCFEKGLELGEQRNTVIAKNQLQKEFLEMLLTKFISPSEIAQKAYFVWRQYPESKTVSKKSYYLQCVKGQLEARVLYSLSKEDNYPDGTEIPNDISNDSSICQDDSLIEAARQLKEESLIAFASIKELSENANHVECEDNRGQKELEAMSLKKAFEAFNKTISFGELAQRAYTINHSQQKSTVPNQNLWLARQEQLQIKAITKAVQAEIAARKVSIAKSDKEHYEEMNKSVITSVNFLSKSKVNQLLDNLDRAQISWQSAIEKETKAKRESLQVKTERFAPYDNDLMRIATSVIASTVSAIAKAAANKEAEEITAGRPSKRTTAIEQLDLAMAQRKSEIFQASDKDEIYHSLINAEKMIERLNIVSEESQKQVIYYYLLNISQEAAETALLNDVNKIDSCIHKAVKKTDEGRLIRDMKIKRDAAVFHHHPLAIAVREIEEKASAFLEDVK